MRRPAMVYRQQATESSTTGKNMLLIERLQVWKFIRERIILNTYTCTNIFINDK